MNSFFTLVGLFIVALVALYLILYALFKILKLGQELYIPPDKMPVMRPLPIPTKKQKNALHRLLSFMFNIRRWELNENWYFQLTEEDLLVINKGFTFDGASIPKLFWAFISPTGLLLIPGLLHDYGYKYDQLWKITKEGKVEAFKKDGGKKYWDKLFREVGDRVNGVFLVNVIAWLGVIMGGKCAWKNHRKNNLKPEVPDI